MDSSSIKLRWKVYIEWIVFEQNTIHSIQTFQCNPFDGDSPYPFYGLFIRVYQKNDWVARPTNPSCGMTPINNIESVKIIVYNSVVSVMQKETPAV